MAYEVKDDLVVDTAHPDPDHPYSASGDGIAFISADADTTFTQTYSTTTATVPNVTWSAYVVTATADAPAGGTGVAGGCYDTAGHRDSFIAVINANRADVVGLHAAEAALAADTLTNRKLLNAIIDAMQANGVAA